MYDVGRRVKAMGKLISCLVYYRHNMLQKYPDHTPGKQPSTEGEELRTIYILIVHSISIIKCKFIHV